MGFKSTFQNITLSLLIVALLLGGCDSEHKQGGEAILDSFAAGCQSYGEWSQAALAQTKALETAIASLLNNDKCKNVAGVLGTTQTISTEIQRLQTNSSIMAEKKAEETKRQILLELASSANNPALLDQLMPLLAQAEVDLAAARANSSVTRDNEGNSAMVRGLNQLSTYVTTLLSSSTKMGACAQDNPMLGAQLGASALAILGTFLNPAIGAAISIGGQALSAIVDFFRKQDMEEALGRLQSARLSAALACGLESMANTYCEAQDVFRLTELQANSYDSQWKPSKFWEGLDLWSKKVPDLMDWVSRVASGVTPTDPTSASRQNEVWRKVNMLKEIVRSAEGSIAFTLRKLEHPPESGNRGAGYTEATTRSGLLDLLNLMHGTGPSGRPTNESGLPSPISEFYPNRPGLLYRLVGRDPKEDNCNPSSSASSCLGTDNIQLPIGGFSMIAENARKIFSEVSDQLLATLHLVIDVDSQGLLKEATQPIGSGKASPVSVMLQVINFLEGSAKYFDSLGTPESQQIIGLIRETQKILYETVDLILKAPGTEAGDQGVIRKLFENLKLIYGADFISGRIYRHIKWDLNSRIQNGQAPADLLEILKASGRDAARELSKVPRSSLDALLQDISVAQSVSQLNVEAFVELFKKGFSASVQGLKEAADRAGEPVEGAHRPNRMLQARLCILLLTTSSVWPEDIDPKLCSATVVESIYPAMKEKLRFEELLPALKKEPLEKKMCIYQRFLRRSRLASVRPTFLEFGTVSP